MTIPIMTFFDYSSPPKDQQAISRPICELADLMDQILPGSTEKGVGLRKLLEAKDCFVRASLQAQEEAIDRMEVISARKLKAEFEASLLLDIRGFEDNTGLAITDIELRHTLDRSDGALSTISASITVKV